MPVWGERIMATVTEDLAPDPGDGRVEMVADRDREPGMTSSMKVPSTQSVPRRVLSGTKSARVAAPIIAWLSAGVSIFSRYGPRLPPACS